MAIRVIDDTKLQNIAVAIQSKDNGGQMTVDQMAGRIDNIIVAPVPVQNPALILWDWEGTKLAEYSAEDALALTELPAPDTLPAYADVDHDLFLFQSWNWSLASVKSWIQNHEGEILDVDAIYITTDGQDHNYWGNPRLDTANTIIMQKRGTANIGVNAFQNYRSLTRINLPNGVTSIGNNAFQGCPLTRINLPNSIASIGYSAFQGCGNLTRINLPNSIISIGNNAFMYCGNLTRINLPNRVTSIAFSTFQGCYSLTQINIHNSIVSIGYSAFQDCKTLCDVLLESKAALANINAFSGLPSIYRVYVPRANLSWFETETNWATIYSQGHIVAIEDYIEYLESIGFNVDAYKGAA